MISLLHLYEKVKNSQNNFEVGGVSLMIIFYHITKFILKQIFDSQTLRVFFSHRPPLQDIVKELEAEVKGHQVKAYAGRNRTRKKNLLLNACKLATN